MNCDLQKKTKRLITSRRAFKKSALSKVIESDVASAIEAVRCGFSAQVVVQLADYLNLSLSQFCQSVRFKAVSIRSRVAKKGTLTSFESDTLYRVGKLIKQAQDVFEDEASASAWFVRENRALGDVSPLSLLDSAAGYTVVMQALVRIEQGLPC